MEFITRDELIYYVIKNNHVYLGEFCYLVTCSDKKINQWLKQFELEMKIENDKYYLIEL